MTTIAGQTLQDSEGTDSPGTGSGQPVLDPKDTTPQQRGNGSSCFAGNNSSGTGDTGTPCIPLSNRTGTAPTGTGEPSLNTQIGAPGGAGGGGSSKDPQVTDPEETDYQCRRCKEKKKKCNLQDQHSSHHLCKACEKAGVDCLRPEGLEVEGNDNAITSAAGPSSGAGPSSSATQKPKPTGTGKKHK